MRITEGMMTEQYLSNYNKVASKVSQIQTQLSTNTRLNTLSDDLASSLLSIDIQNQINKTDTYIKNSQNAKGFMAASLSALDNMTSEVQKIMTQMTTAQNPMNQQNFPTILQSIKNSLEAITQDFNTKQNNMYLFGGTNYNTPPVSIDTNGKAVPTAADISGLVNVQLSQNVNTAINIPGSDLLATGLLTAVNDVIDTLASGTAPTQTQVNAIQDSYNQLLNIQSVGGEKSNRIDDISSLLTSTKTNLESSQANVSGIDTAKLAVELQNQNYIMQVSQKVLAQTFPQSLFDYI